MKTGLPVLLLVLASHFALGQISFERGYFIDTLGQRTECEIKNRDWRNNPIEFEYKILDKISSMPVPDVKEFGVYGKSKYVVAEVQIDKSPVSLNALSRQRNAEFETKILALKVLVEGRAMLLMHENQNVVRFFYSIDRGNIRQLVYKMYHSASGKVLENNEYQQDLVTKVNCNNTEDEVKRTAYKKSDLLTYFTNYNACSGSGNVTIAPPAKQSMFIRPTLGVGATTMKYTYSDIYDKLVMKNGPTYRIGAELEMMLPFNSNHWSIVTDLYYLSSTNSGNFENPSKGKFKATYAAVEFAAGARYYVFLHGGNKIFFNAFVLAGKPTRFDLDYQEDFNVYGYEPKLFVRVNTAYGAGFSFKKLNTELRFIPTKTIRKDEVFENSFTRLMIIFSYPLN